MKKKNKGKNKMKKQEKIVILIMNYQPKHGSSDGRAGASR